MVGEAVIVDENHGETVMHAFFDDLALFRRDAGADEDGALGGLVEAARLLRSEARGILAVADHRQAAALRKEGAVAEAVAGDEARGGSGGGRRRGGSGPSGRTAGRSVGGGFPAAFGGRGEQLAFDGGQRLGGDLAGGAFALQIAAQGGKGERGVDAAAAGR